MCFVGSPKGLGPALGAEGVDVSSVPLDIVYFFYV